MSIPRTKAKSIRRKRALKNHPLPERDKAYYAKQSFIRKLAEGGRKLAQEMGGRHIILDFNRCRSAQRLSRAIPRSEPQALPFPRPSVPEANPVTPGLLRQAAEERSK